jgi:hypothetical protein
VATVIISTGAIVRAIRASTALRVKRGSRSKERACRIILATTATTITVAIPEGRATATDSNHEGAVAPYPQESGYRASEACNNVNGQTP